MSAVPLPFKRFAPWRIVAACILLWPLPTPMLTAQTNWFKYEGNPVMDVGPPGSWEGEGLGAPRIVFRDSIYQMWYTGRRGSDVWRIGYATSSDGVNWKKNSSNPILGPTESWEEDHVWLAEVNFSGSEYETWYNGLDKIGYATSPDGIQWRKHPLSPILRPGPSAWEEAQVNWPCVMILGKKGGFRMWFAAVDEHQKLFQIGHAIAVDETTWVKFAGNPILEPGAPGAWDDRGLETPRVLFDGELYEMWYAGSRTSLNIFHSSTGYATSPDGIHWTKDRRNPVLSPGPAGSWDSEGASVGDVLFDGEFYHMWYTGYDYGARLRIGYAVSPRDLNASISPSYVTPLTGAVRIAAHVNPRTAFSLYATITSSDPSWSSGSPSPGKKLEALQLFDDGEHGDSLAGDGLFANNWRPKKEGLYSVDLRMEKKARKPLGFDMQRVGVFTTIGPIRIDTLEVIGNPTPHPGDTVLIKLVLGNHGSSAVAPSVTASLSSTDSLVTQVSELSPSYGDIPPEGQESTQGYYRLFISPECPPNADVHLTLSISSLGTQLWTDSFSFRVWPPWWATGWAYASYGALVLVVLYGLRRYEVKRTRLKHQRELERVEAEKLRELDQMKSRFFANISHEFRTPLTLLLGPIEKWKERAADQNLQNDLGAMERNARRLLRLINQLLDLSKIEAGSMRLQASPGNIVAFVKSIAESFQLVAASKNITLRIESTEDHIEVFFDRDKMEKIVCNLLSNAFKFTAEGGDIGIKIRYAQRGSQNYIAIDIADTGIGIPEEHLPHVFDRFYQVNGTHTRAHEGTGIGLALVNELVNAHHGTISVASTVQKGTTFSIQLPVGSEHLKAGEIVQPTQEEEPPCGGLEASLVAEDSSRRIAEDQPIDAGKPMILVVEDNADVRLHVRECLGPDYAIVESHDGREGVRKATEIIPDLIISDVMMPITNGYELCRILKQDQKTSHIPIILLTAKACRESRIEGLETGADDYVAKPFDALELKVRVHNLIDQRRALRERFGKEVILRPPEIAVASGDERFLNRAMGVVETHMSDGTFTAEVFAKEMFLSQMQLHRKLKALTNRSPWEFVRTIRLTRAAQLLERRAGNVAEVAYHVGYTDPSHFADAFKHQFGLSPSEFQRTRNHPSTSPRLSA